MRCVLLFQVLKVRWWGPYGFEHLGSAERLLVLLLLLLFLLPFPLLLLLLPPSEDKDDENDDEDDDEDDEEDDPPGVARALASASSVSRRVNWFVLTGAVGVCPEFAFLGFARTVRVRSVGAVGRLVLAASVLVFAELASCVFSFHDVVLAGLRIERRFESLSGRVSQRSVGACASYARGRLNSS